MRALISGFTAFALAAHMVLGCCWHHVHTCNGEDPLQSPCSEDHAHRLMSDGYTYEEHQPNDVCNLGRCVVILGISSYAPATFSTVSSGEAVPTACVDGGMSVQPRSRGACPLAGNAALPVRAHLMHQVLLL